MRFVASALVILAACSSPSVGPDGGASDGGLAVELRIMAPPAPAVGVPFPVTIVTADGSPATLPATLEADGASQRVMLYRGRGSASLIASVGGPLLLGARAGGATATLAIAAAERAERVLSGTLGGADLFWDAGADIHLTGATTIAAAAALSIAAGTRVLIDDRVSLTVLGTLRASGSPADPIVISRAGASTVAELVATCSPSILVPYPYAADDHQRFNAKSIADAGGAELVLNQDLGERLAERIFYYESNREALGTMKEKLRQLRGIPAAEAVTRECLGLMMTGR